MVKATTVTLISEPSAHGVFDTVVTTSREVFCTVKSVTRREVYEAKANGLSPEYVLVLEHDFEYQGEKECTFESKAYDILRTYVTDTDGIELVIQRKEGNAHVQ